MAIVDLPGAFRVSRLTPHVKDAFEVSFPQHGAVLEGVLSPSLPKKG